jgi:hypothetical protein
MMNKQQRDYAASRVSEISCAKCAAIDEKYTTPAVSLSQEARIAAFKAKKYKVNPGLTKINCYTKVIDIVSFTDEKPEKKDVKKIKEEKAKVTAEASKIVDELMLGDATEALKLIQAFGA